MINEETLVRLGKISKMCENLSETLEKHCRDVLEELDYIYDEVDDMLHNNKESDNDRKKATIVFTGEDWRIDTYDERGELVGTTIFNTLIGYPANYVDDDIIGMIEILTSQNYEISYEYKLKNE
jgi:hypothetical protein